MIVTRFAWIAQRFLNKFPQILQGLTRFSWEGCSELTRLRIDEQGRLPPLLEERGWLNSATVIRLLHSRSIVSSCPARLLEPTKMVTNGESEPIVAWEGQGAEKRVQVVKMAAFEGEGPCFVGTF